MTNPGDKKFISITIKDNPSTLPYFDILYFKDNYINLEKAIEVSKMKSLIEDDYLGEVSNIIAVMEDNVHFSRSASIYFGNPQQISGINNLAMHVVGMKRWVVKFLNMTYALKGKPNTKYFNSKEECVSWLEKLIKIK